MTNGQKLAAKMLRLNRCYISDYEWVVCDFALAYLKEDSSFNYELFYLATNCDLPQIGTPESVYIRNATR